VKKVELIFENIAWIHRRYDDGDLVFLWKSADKTVKPLTIIKDAKSEEEQKADYDLISLSLQRGCEWEVWPKHYKEQLEIPARLTGDQLRLLLSQT